MNLVYLLFLSTIKSLTDVSNIITPNQRQPHEFITSNNSTQNLENYQKRYDNFTVFSIEVHNKRQYSVLKRLTSDHKNFDFWQNDGEKLHIMVHPNKINYFQNLTKIGRLETKVLIENVQKLIDDEQATQIRLSDEHFSWRRYNTLDEINAWLDNITAEFPKITESFTIGTSTESRQIRGIKISYRTANPGIFIESHIHAREWITSATATWIINELLKSKEIKIRYLAENYDWYIVPVLNVDGFVFTYNGNRLWRKTRSRHTNTTNPYCIGVDGNRNHNSHWLENGGGSTNPCDVNYAGPFPLSEPEIRGLENYINSIKDKINIFLAFHSYSQKLLSPFGYTNTKKPDNFDDIMQVAKAFSEAVGSLPYHTKYGQGSTADELYIASGCSSDWAYEQGIRLSYTIEFRDQGQYGFLLPSAYIIPNSEEALTGIFALVIEADNLGYMNLKYNSTWAKTSTFNLAKFFKWPTF